MRQAYKKLGDFIQLIDERNRDLSITTLLGLSIDKVFIPSVANTVGSNMANYKIIRKSQFACSLMQVRRDKKIPVAMLNDYDEAIISQAYPVFEIKDKEKLLPEYLMMWMSRSEFDREACFYAVGGVRGSLEWDDFCNMELPVPSIEKQQEIVREYHTIVDRIKLNEQLNQKLEETAQAIYKQWFVDFEFPVDSPPVEGWQAKPDGVVSFKRDTKAYRSLPYNPKLKDRAKALRKTGVLSEVLIWQEVHKKKFKGLDFDRQKIIGNYIVDFYCPNLNVVVEIDGSSHDNKQEYDAERDAYLKGLGLTVIHIKDIDVKSNLQGVMDYLREHEAFQMDCGHAENNHPALRAPLQRRGIGYKSSGGEMVWNEELDQEIPKGWQMESFTDFIRLGGGGTPSTVVPEYWSGEHPFFTGRDVTARYYSLFTEKSITIEGLENSSARLYPMNTTFVVARGATTGAVALSACQMAMNQSCYAVVSSQVYFTHQLTLTLMRKMKKQTVGGAIFSAIVTKDFCEQMIISPQAVYIEKFEEHIGKIYHQILTNLKDSALLSTLLNLLLSRLTKVEAAA